MKWTIRASFATPILVLLSVFLAGGGHGFIGPMLILFPGVFAFQFVDDTFSWLLMLVQFPLYGIIIDQADKWGKTQWILVFLAILHFVLIILGLNSVAFN